MSPIPNHIFRANDIRGIADVDLTDALVKQIAGGFGTFLSKREINSVGLGFDVRLTSPRIVKAFKDELAKFPLTIYELGMIPSPVGYFINHQMKEVEAVTIVTASHNPSEYNGIKFCVKGKSLTQECIKELQELSESYIPKIKAEASFKEINANQAYIDFISKKFTDDVALLIGNTRLTLSILSLYAPPNAVFKSMYPLLIIAEVISTN